MLVRFHGLRFNLPPGWTDITDDLPDDSPPTLARQSGNGAIQFSTATYRGDNNPIVTVEGLRALLSDFCSRQLLTIDEMEEKSARISMVGCLASTNEKVTAAWYLTNGRDIVLVTYVPQGSDYSEELSQARDLVATIDF